MTLRLSRAMGMSQEGLLDVKRGALLHDIGKMGIPDQILLKAGPLSEDEWKIMRQHPALAFKMLAPIPYLRKALDIPYCHHEHWDGSGYPRGFKGEQIPLSARIFSVVDVWDALNSDRLYRAAWPVERVREHIRGAVATQFDPDVVRRFFELLDADSR
jgi:HD-GYP domain-containing protein (c-di-GMP phosphodiesterase class II)